MSTNSLTLSHVIPGITDEVVSLRREYGDALRTAARAILDGFDDIAAYAYGKARTLAHRAAEVGEYEPILDQLNRAAELDDDE